MHCLSGRSFDECSSLRLQHRQQLIRFYSLQCALRNISECHLMDIWVVFIFEWRRNNNQNNSVDSVSFGAGASAVERDRCCWRRLGMCSRVLASVCIFAGTAQLMRKLTQPYVYVARDANESIWLQLRSNLYGAVNYIRSSAYSQQIYDGAEGNKNKQ